MAPFRVSAKEGPVRVSAPEALAVSTCVADLLLAEYPCGPGTRVAVPVPGATISLTLVATFFSRALPDDRSELTAWCQVVEEAAVARDETGYTFFYKMDWREAWDRLSLADFGRCYLELPALVMAVEQQHLAQKLV